MTKDELKSRIWSELNRGKNFVWDNIAELIDRIMTQQDPQPLVTGLDWREIEKEYTTASLGQMEGIVEDIISTLKQQKRWVVVFVRDEKGVGSWGCMNTAPAYCDEPVIPSERYARQDEAQAECARRNGGEEEKMKYYYEPETQCIYSNDDNNVWLGVSHLTGVATDTILDALNAEAGKEKETPVGKGEKEG